MFSDERAENPYRNLETRAAAPETNQAAATPVNVLTEFSAGFWHRDQDVPALSNREAEATLARWRHRQKVRAAEEAAAEGPSRGVIITLWSRGPTTPSFAINTEWLACKDAALLAATCKNTIKDENLKERYSEEARKAEKDKNDKKTFDKIQSLLDESEFEISDTESEFEIDEDGHWHVRRERTNDGIAYESYGLY